MSDSLKTAGFRSFEIETVTVAQCLVPESHPDLTPLQDEYDPRGDAYLKRSRCHPEQQPWVNVNELWKQTFELKDLPELIEALQKGGDQNCFLVAQCIRKMLSKETSPPIQEVLEANLLPSILSWMQRSDFTQLQFEAAWAFTNIASGVQPSGPSLVEMGCIPLLISLLESPNEDVSEQAVWALGNLAGDSYTCRDLVLQSGALPFLLAYLQRSQRLSAIRNSCWAVSNMCRGKPKPRHELVACAGAILADVLRTQQDVEVISDCSWAFSYLSDGDRDSIQEIIDTRVGEKLAELLLRQTNIIQVPVLRTFGNFTTTDHAQTQYVLDVGALDGIIACLQSTKKIVRKEAVWSLSNIAAGTPMQLAKLIESGVIATLIEMLHSETPDIKKECIWTLSNALDGKDPHVVDYMVETGAVEAFSELLDNCTDVKMLNVMLDALAIILNRYKDAEKGQNVGFRKLEECGALSKLEALQMHASRDIYEKVVNIIAMHFEVDE